MFIVNRQYFSGRKPDSIALNLVVKLNPIALDHALAGRLARLNNVGSCSQVRPNNFWTSYSSDSRLLDMAWSPDPPKTFNIYIFFILYLKKNISFKMR